MIKVGCGLPNGLLCGYFPVSKAKMTQFQQCLLLKHFSEQLQMCSTTIRRHKLSTTLDADFLATQSCLLQHYHINEKVISKAIAVFFGFLALETEPVPSISPIDIR